MKSYPFFIADAHEGCVWVASQQRLYFSTTTDIPRRNVDLCYFDFSGLGLRESPDNWLRIDKDLELKAQLFLADLNLANSFSLSNSRNSLLVCEQGDEHRPSVISSIDLSTKDRTVLVDSFHGVPFNSLNKVVISKQGHLVFSDPDYGFRQGFRPVPEMAPRLYVQTAAGKLFAHENSLKMPHGLAFSQDEKHLFVTDTSNDGAHSEAIDLNRCKDVYRFNFDSATGQISGDPQHCFQVDEGVPDGCLFVNDHFLTGAGDGVYIADHQGKLLRKIALERTAVNLDAVGPMREHLFVTADEGIYFIPNWAD